MTQQRDGDDIPRQQRVAGMKRLAVEHVVILHSDDDEMEVVPSVSNDLPSIAVQTPACLHHGKNDDQFCASQGVSDTVRARGDTQLPKTLLLFDEE